MNGADLSAFTKSGGGEEVKRKLGLEGKFVAAYVGTHGMAHGLDTILDAAALVEGRSALRFPDGRRRRGGGQAQGAGATPRSSTMS